MKLESAAEIVRQTLELKSGIDISFQNLTYKVQIQQKSEGLALPFNKNYTDKVIINNLSGIFKAGQLSAIMGASGAGKTTLLNLIACRMDVQSGKLWVNNQNYGYQDFGHFANYVMQTDVLMATMTVRQTLNFAANLKLSCSEQEKKSKINKISMQLKLDKCMDTLVGNPMIKGISGGEKKRTSIAFELISDPQVIMLDEPTSGLDSLTSFVIVEYLRNLSRAQNKTVIMTIHQPNSDIFALFDKLLLMVQGRFIYQGPSSEAVKYFDWNFGLKCPEFYNPADYFMNVMHPENKSNRDRYDQYFDKYQKMISYKVQEDIQKRSIETIVKRQVELSLATTYKQLVYRDLINVLRNPLMIKARFFQTTILYVYAGGLYYNSFDGNYTNNNDWKAVTGFFFFLALNSMMISLVPLTLTFPKEREIFLKEESSKLYTTTAYFISRNIIEIPYAFIFPMLQALIVYWFVGLANTATQFWIFYLILYFVGFNGMSLGLLLGSVITDAKAVSTVAPALAIVVALFSGFFKNFQTIPAWISWIQYLSPIRYSYEAFVRNQVQFAAASNIGQQNFELTLWSSIGILIALGVFFRCVSLFFLWLLRTRIQ